MIRRSGSTATGRRPVASAAGPCQNNDSSPRIVADSQGKEVGVPKTSVEERSTAQLSPMPANMADQIAVPEFNGLMSYLLKHRDEKAPR